LIACETPSRAARWTGCWSLNRQHGAQARLAAQGIERRSLGAGEHPAPDQAAVCVVECIAVGMAGCATVEASLVEVLHHGRVGELVVAFQRQQV